MFTIRTVPTIAGDSYEVTCCNSSLANEVIEAAFRHEASPNFESADSCVVMLFYCSEEESEAIVIEARNNYDAACMAVPMAA